jgi:hypothetical protein
LTYPKYAPYFIYKKKKNRFSFNIFSLSHKWNFCRREKKAWVQLKAPSSKPLISRNAHYKEGVLRSGAPRLPKKAQEPLRTPKRFAKANIAARSVLECARALALF